MSRSSELTCLLYGSILFRTKYSKGRSLLCILLLPLRPKPDYHLNGDEQEGALPEKKDEKRQRRKMGLEWLGTKRKEGKEEERKSN
uniref:Uncharacterized protein n=1 Tax=Cucumis melo TaxID=3656 RepID=A0A9I9ELL4_CUCME